MKTKYSLILILILNILILNIILFSCSKSPEEKAQSLADNLCSKLTDKPGSASILELKKLFEKEITSDENLKSDTIQQALIKKHLEECFRSLFYTKNIKNLFSKGKILGSGASLFQLVGRTTGTSDDAYEITLVGTESTAFKILLALKPREIIDIDKKEILNTDAISGVLTLLDANSQELDKYKFYPSLDLIKILKQGSGTAFVDVFLAPVWDSFSEDPFRTAVNGFEIIEKARFFTLELDLKSNMIKSDSSLINKTDKFVEGMNF